MNKVYISETEETIRVKKYCHKCGRETTALLVQDITTSGVSQIYWKCEVCNKPIDETRRCIPHKTIRDFRFGGGQHINIEKLPIVKDNSQITTPCEVCGKFGVELHHWAPKHLFGDTESEKWPKAWLCRECHAKWHKLVTPNMCEKKNE